MCRDPMPPQEATTTTSIHDTLDQLRELYHEVKKRTKKREGEASYYQETEDDGQLGPVRFL